MQPGNQEVARQRVDRGRINTGRAALKAGTVSPCARSCPGAMRRYAITDAVPRPSQAGSGRRLLAWRGVSASIDDPALCRMIRR
jgi:hypothetical protein